ncbi:MAG: class I SAM-dependent methyltransferase [Thermomicrobiales bacterium]
MTGRSPDFPDYTAPATESWDNLAEWWDDQIGDGNPTQDLVVEPNTEKLLELKPGERVLDIACGAGRFARRMADAGAIVTAFDHAERFVNRARERSKGYEDRISYHVVNATDVDGMLALGAGEFDAAVCTMAIMDMAEITPLFSTLPKLLKPDGRFVFSITHPVFNTEDSRPTVERIAVGTDMVNRYAVSVASYLETRMEKGIGVPGQPDLQHYFHRPLGMLVNTASDCGLVLDRLEEPAFPRGLPADNPMAQSNFEYIPWVLLARFRVAGR